MHVTGLGKAALAYARLGWRVHPCRPRSKLPLLKGWPKKASADVDAVAEWYREHPDGNVAVATGPDSGIFVLDVDGPEGERALVELEHRHGTLPELYPTQWTGSGKGWQAFFAWPEGRVIRNSAGRLGPKLDTRGDGGYVLLPPSVHPSGGVYRWADDRSPFILPPEPAPDWLIELLDPPAVPEPERPAWSLPAGGKVTEAYLLRAFKAELALTAMAASGERNNQLYSSARSLFRFVADGRMPSAVITRALSDAAAHAGLDRTDAMKTIASAAGRAGVSP